MARNYKPILRSINVAAVCLLVASDGYAQCVSSSFTQDASSDYQIRMYATSSQMNCTNRSMIVSAWIDYLSFTCITGTTQSGRCTDSDTNGNAFVHLHKNICGYAQGNSLHSWTQPGSTGTLPSRTQPLYAGDCAQLECALQGPDYYWNGSECIYTPGSPILIAVGGDSSYKLTSPEHGVHFDIDGDGVVERMGWTEADSEVALLAIDRDGDGAITSGRELFGNHTLPGRPNGFAALAQMNMDTNGGVARGSVNSSDPLFERLLLWTDRNHNGVSEAEELQPAAALLSDIGLAYEIHNRRDGHGNQFRFRGWVSIRTGPGRNHASEISEQQRRKRHIYDVFFKIASQ